MNSLTKLKDNHHASRHLTICIKEMEVNENTLFSEL